MNVRVILLFGVVVILLTPMNAVRASGDAGTSPRPSTDSYHVVFHHQIKIQKPAAIVWPHLIRQNSWIDFDLIHVSGPRLQEGEVFRLYEGQEFYVQTIKLIPNELYVGVNLPSTFEGEDSTGIAVFSLTESDGKTVVTVTMSRQYFWVGDGPNPMRKIRESEQFRESTRALWEEKFLPRLRELAESDE